MIDCVPYIIGETKLIGLSVPNCISNVLHGEVKESDIAFIQSATPCQTPEDWNQLIQSCASSQWKHYPEKGKKIASALVEFDKLIQPRNGQERAIKPNSLITEDGNTYYARLHWLCLDTGKPVFW